MVAPKLLNKVKENELMKTPVFTVVEKEYESLEFKPVGLNCKDWVMIIAKDSSSDPVCVFVKQTRWGCEHSTIEFPCGTVDLNESPVEAAVREFREETGIEVAHSSLKEIATFNPNPAYFNNLMHIFEFVDRGLLSKFLNKKRQKLDKTEDCEVFVDRLENQATLLKKGGMSLIGYVYASKVNTSAKYELKEIK